MNPQLLELFIAFGVTAAAMLVGLVAMGASAHAYWRWPVYSAMVMVLGVVLWNLLHRHLVPAAWDLTHASLLYYGALTLYAVLGLALGLVVGKAMRKKPAPEDETGAA